MKDRVPNIRESTVRIFVKGQPVGSGFIVHKDGLIVTCFHVVQQLNQGAGNQVHITFAQDIEVELLDGTRKAAQVMTSCQNTGFLEALSKDYAILNINTSGLLAVKIGSFTDVVDGCDIYLSGYPFGIDQSIVASGLLSTKWITAGYFKQGSNRNVAWPDITMNSGNSGGPVLLRGNTYNDDVVIGIATFGLNPFAAPVEEVVSVVASFPGNAVLAGLDIKKFSVLVGQALKSNSLGVGGCVSIEYVKTLL